MKNMEILSQLFGGIARVKLLRLFLFNENTHFSTEDITSKTRLTKTTVRKELRALEKIGFLTKRTTNGASKSTATKKGKKGTAKRKTSSKNKNVEYALSPRFVYKGALKELMSLNDPVSRKDIADKLKKGGKLKLVIISGFFIGNTGDRVDLLIVGDALKKGEIDRAVGLIESDVGREISYTLLETHDFLYRIAIKDRLIRDVLDYPHERVIEKITW